MEKGVASGEGRGWWRGVWLMGAGLVWRGVAGGEGRG